jgi:hypothetical protein
VAATWLTEAEFADFVRDLQEVVQPCLANAPGKGRRRRMMYSVLLPAPDQPATADEPDRAPDRAKPETKESP